MRKKTLLKSVFSVLFMILLIFQSCSKDNFEPEKTKQSIEITEVVLRLLDMGYSLDDIEESDNFYIVEGDIAFSKNIKDYHISGNSNARHYHSTNLVGNNFIGNIYVLSEISGPISIDPTGNTWRNGINQAIEAWNSVGGDSCIHFELTTDPFLADITITDGVVVPLNASQFGRAGTPPIDGGKPFETVWINLKYPNSSLSSNPIDPSSTTLTQKRNIIAHELGHCIGFKHTDGNYTTQPIDGAILIPGTLAADPDSIMLDELAFLNNQTTLSSTDKFAANTLYGGCSIINPNITISGPSSICFEQATYTLSGDTVVDWTVSTNLSIIAENGNSVTVQLAHSSPVIGGTYVEAQLTDGSLERKYITSGGPSPNGSAVITGPTLLKYYQTGLFETSNSNFNSYTNVEWVVFSYVFPNAGQHFDIDQNYSNDFLAEVEVLPSAPEGFYTIQCRVSNNCGTYYIDKEFEVKKGKPQIFGF